MGVCITATNSSYDFYGGSGSFLNLRCNIALAWDKEFGEHYNTIKHCHDSEDYKAFDRRTEEILSADRFSNNDVDIVEFLFAGDDGGKISYKTCKKIYDLIKDIDFGNRTINYAAHADNDYERFKAFLLECYSKRRCMRWY